MTATVREQRTVAPTGTGAGIREEVQVIATRRRLGGLSRRRARPVGPPPTRPADEPRLVVSTALAMLSLLCLWLALQLVVLGGLAQARDQDLLYGQLRSQLAEGTAPLGPVTPVGDPVAVLSIPSLGVEQTVVEGTSSTDLLAGPGHLRSTVLPGQVGTSVLMGRSQTYGAPFADLDSLRPGDTINTTSAQGTRAFTVIGVRRPGDVVPQPAASGAARLVLLTSEDTGGWSSLSAGAVLYVDADAAEGFPAPAGLPLAVPDTELPLHGDTASLPLLVLYLAGLLAVSLGLVWARQRHPAVLVWVVGAPVALAVTWATTDVAVRLLPNLL